MNKANLIKFQVFDFGWVIGYFFMFKILGSSRLITYYLIGNRLAITFIERSEIISQYTTTDIDDMIAIYTQINI